MLQSTWVIVCAEIVNILNYRIILTFPKNLLYKCSHHRFVGEGTLLDICIGMGSAPMVVGVGIYVSRHSRLRGNDGEKRAENR